MTEQTADTLRDAVVEAGGQCCGCGVGHTIYEDFIAPLLAENEQLRALIRRALAELDVPADYGPGTAWDDMLNAVDGWGDEAR